MRRSELAYIESKGFKFAVILGNLIIFRGPPEAPTELRTFHYESEARALAARAMFLATLDVTEVDEDGIIVSFHSRESVNENEGREPGEQ